MDLITYALTKRLVDVQYPPNFPWKPFKVFKIGKRQYATDFDEDKYRNPGAGKTYFVTTIGLSTNDGLTWDTALSLPYALQKPDVDRIIIRGGLYDRNYGFNGIVPTRNIAIIGVGKAILSNHDSALTWTATGGQTNVWQTTRSSLSNICDASSVDSNGDYAKLTLQTSVADVNANPGSYYVDGSNVVYVKTSDQRQPDSNIRVYLSTTANSVAGNTITYLENIFFEGGSNAFKCYSSGGYRPTVVVKGCKFKYGGQAGSGCFANVGAISYLIDCETAKGDQDGFNYHINEGLTPYFVEIDCIGRHNGRIDGNDNGSTAHDAAIGIRINGKYHNNMGPNVIDINDGAYSWCIGTEAYDSAAILATHKANFSTYGETATRSNMYLYDCYSHGTSTYDLKMDQNGHTYVKSCEFVIGLNYGVPSASSILDTY